MAVFERDLIRAINSGQCFALVGTGPSCELGVPSWKHLAEIVIGEMNPSQMKNTIDQCKSLLSSNNYPKIFSLVEKIIGRKKLLNIVNKSLTRITKKKGQIYKLIASWPFTCYLTTNFDDYLSDHLEEINNFFSTRRNSREDLSLLRARSKKMIFKIHGDVSVPEDIVLTSEQYLDFKNSPTRGYWRKKIQSVLHMVDLVIIGYSAKDPDFQDQLERAKTVASPTHPIFMFAANLEIDQIRKYYQKYNIRIIPYSTIDGSHRELIRLLKRYDPFISKRESPLLGLEPIDESISNLAASMYLFTQLRLSNTKNTCIEKTYASVILQILSEHSEKDSIKIDDLSELLAKKTFAASSVAPISMRKALESLHSLGFIKMLADDFSITLETKGKEAIVRIKAERELLQEKFEKECSIFLNREHPTLKPKAVIFIINTLRKGLVRAYEKRGIEIAQSVLSNKAVDISNATDILDIINKESSVLSGHYQRTAFAELMIEVILRPNENIKEYMVALSQGYFAYHALGLEPRCSKERIELAIKKMWILDSSILLPILALNCPNHNYAKDLLIKMQDLGMKYYTTENLFKEVIDHAWWAINNFQEAPYDSPDLLQAAISGPGYKQNLFVDGYINWSVVKGRPSFHQYMRECLGSNNGKDFASSIEKKIEDLEIEIIDFHQQAPEELEEIENIAKDIEQLRIKYGTYRGQPQCWAEAEVVRFTEKENSIFLSQSIVLDKLQRTQQRMTWKPESMYRFLSLFSDAPTNSEFLYDCMIQDFYYVGFNIVDEKAFSKYVAPIIHQTRMEFEQEKEKYEETLGKRNFEEFKDKYDRIPDEQKPFYSMQFAFYVASKEATRRKEAERKMFEAKETKKMTDKEREELERLRREKAQKRKKEEKRRRKYKSIPTTKKKKKRR